MPKFGTVIREDDRENLSESVDSYRACQVVENFYDCVCPAITQQEQQHYACIVENHGEKALALLSGTFHSVHLDK
jgi:hypothetical protein